MPWYTDSSNDAGIVLPDPLANRIWAIRLRWIMIGVLAVSAPAIDRLFRLDIPLIPLFVVCAALALFNLLLQHYTRLTAPEGSSSEAPKTYRIDGFQIAVDGAALPLLFHFTGGIGSFYLLYFLFYILLISVLLPPKRSAAYALTTAGLFNLVAAFELVGGIPSRFDASFIPVDFLENPAFVSLVLLFFDAVLTVGVLLLNSLLTRLDRAIRDHKALQKASEKANEQLAILNKLGRDTTSTFGFFPRLRFICRQVRLIMQVKGAAIHLMDERNDQLRLVSACGLSEEYLQKGPLLADRSLAKARKGKPHFVADVTSDSTLQYPEAARREGIVSILALPLEAREKFIGTLRLYASEKRVFSKDEIEFLTALCGQAAVSIENAKSFEAMEKQDAAKNDFILMMTHELESPLTAMQSILEVLRKKDAGPLSESQSHLVDQMEKRIEALFDVSTVLMDRYQWESRLQKTLEPVAVNEQLQKAADRFMDAAEKKEVRLELDRPEKDPVIRAYPEELEKIVCHLVSNAVKYTPNGGTVRVTAAARDGEVTVRVTDTGIGIAPGDLAHIFSDHFRGRQAKAIDPYGRGLGLGLVKKVVEGFNGTISVQSREGEGTTFEITFPLAKGASPPVGTPE